MEEMDKRLAANLKCAKEAGELGTAAIEAALQRGMFRPTTVAAAQSKMLRDEEER